MSKHTGSFVTAISLVSCETLPQIALSYTFDWIKFDSLFVWVCVYIWSLVREPWILLQWKRASTESGPQAELLIGLVKVQGYRWVTKPPLITNHFCHESRLERKAAKSLHQTKNSDRVCTFLIQRRLWLGRPAHFALHLQSFYLFARPVSLNNDFGIICLYVYQKLDV